jgi:hypothetical protein
MLRGVRDAWTVPARHGYPGIRPIRPSTSAMFQKSRFSAISPRRSACRRTLPGPGTGARSSAVAHAGHEAGTGLPITSEEGFGPGHAEGGGLRGIRERALIVGGAAAINPAPGGGVEVRLEVPAEAS